MPSKKTSAKRKKSTKASWTRHQAFQSHALKNKSTVAKALIECIRTEDTESFKEVLWAHLQTVSAAEFAQKSGLARRTIYNLMDDRKKFNPRLDTVSSIIKSLSA